MVALRASRAWTRRQFLVRSTSSLAVAALATPHLSRAADRPQIAGGIQSGDVSDGSAVIWARADRPARMRVDYSSVESFKTVIASALRDASPDTDFTSKLLLEDLPPGQDVFYRVRFDDIATGIAGESRIGHFRTAPAAGRSISFLWSGDTAGQGWGIDTSRGGYRSYRTMLANRPDFFIHSGDHIYADCTIPSEQKLPNGETWRNVVTEEKSDIAHTLAQFRGNYKYNHLDEHFRAFHADVPMFAQWDDHEVTNDWSPTGSFDEAGYEDDGTPRLVARARRAFFDFMPVRDIGARQGRVYRKIAYGPLLDVFMIDMRSFRDDSWNKGDDHRGWILGAEQLAWLKRELAGSRATWQMIAADLPIGLVSLDAVALGSGPPDRREHEIADLLASIKRAGIRNIVWLTADVHYTAAHYYDPNKAQFLDFEPFWEFVSGPLHAGTFGPNELDNTFGPQLKYIKAPTREQGQNLAPSFDMQFFGHVAIDGASEVMTVTLKDWNDQALWSVKLDPKVG